MPLRSRSAVVLGALAGLLGVGATLLRPVLDLEENVGLASLFALRGPVPAPDDVVVVGIARDSAEFLGLPLDLTEWPRSLHADLLDRLIERGASVVAFDVYFQRPREPAQDARLAEAIKASRSVILLDRMDRRITLAGDGDALTADREIIREDRSRPLPAFRDAAAATVPFPLPVVPIRTSQFWTFLPSAADSPTLPVAALQLHLLKALQPFRDLVAELRPVLADRLPPMSDTDRLRKSDALEIMMRNLRMIFESDPDLVGAMRERIRSGPVGTRDDETRRQLLALLSIYGGPRSRFVNYYGPPQSIATVPYHEAVVDNDGFDESWSGKTVFIGFSERTQPDQQDTFYSVFSERSGLNLSGVEIAATAFANLLEARPVAPLTIPQALLAVALWGAVLGTGTALLSTGAAVAASLAAAGAYVAFAVHQFGSSGSWWPIVVPLFIQLPIALFGAAWLNYARAHGRSSRLSRATRQYLPDQVVRRMEDEGMSSTTHYELVDGICLATDADQYTALSEDMAPEALAGVLNNYYDVLFDIVERNGGQVTDVVGDSMVAVWSSHGSPADVCTSACRAALDIASAQTPHGRPADIALPTRVGLHGGEFLLGTIGAKQHLEFRAVGDTVNSASRMQDLNKQLGTRVLVSSQALDAEHSVSRELGTFMVAGKQAALTVHELLGAGAGQPELLERFAAALATYRAGQLEEALAEFGALLSRFPNDGPSRFYRNLCRRQIGDPRGEPWDAVIRLPGK